MLQQQHPGGEQAEDVEEQLGKEEAQEGGGDVDDKTAYIAGVVILLGVPLTWLVKSIFVRLFVACFGTLKAEGEKEEGGKDWKWKDAETIL